MRKIYTKTNTQFQFKIKRSHKTVTFFGNNVDICKKIAVLMYKDIHNIDCVLSDIIVDDIIVMDN